MILTKWIRVLNNRWRTEKQPEPPVILNVKSLSSYSMVWWLRHIYNCKLMNSKRQEWNMKRYRKINLRQLCIVLCCACSWRINFNLKIKCGLCLRIHDLNQKECTEKCWRSKIHVYMWMCTYTCSSIDYTTACDRYFSFENLPMMIWFFNDSKNNRLYSP